MKPCWSKLIQSELSSELAVCEVMKAEWREGGTRGVGGRSCRPYIGCLLSCWLGNDLEITQVGRAPPSVGREISTPDHARGGFSVQRHFPRSGWQMQLASHNPCRAESCGAPGGMGSTTPPRSVLHHQQTVIDPHSFWPSASVLAHAFLYSVFLKHHHHVQGRNKEITHHPSY